MHREGIFPKVVRLQKWCRTVYRQNIVGPNFQKHLLPHFKDLWVLGPWSCVFLEAPHFWLHCSRLCVFCSEKLPPVFLEAPHVWLRCSRQFLFRKWPPDFWKPHTSDYFAAGCFFSSEKPPIILEAPRVWLRCRRRFFCLRKMVPGFLEQHGSTLPGTPDN